jgi:hypothetical protein
MEAVFVYAAAFDSGSYNRSSIMSFSIQFHGFIPSTVVPASISPRLHFSTPESQQLWLVVTKRTGPTSLPMIPTTLIFKPQTQQQRRNLHFQNLQRGKYPHDQQIRRKLRNPRHQKLLKTKSLQRVPRRVLRSPPYHSTRDLPSQAPRNLPHPKLQTPPKPQRVPRKVPRSPPYHSTRNPPSPPNQAPRKPPRIAHPRRLRSKSPKITLHHVSQASTRYPTISTPKIKDTGYATGKIAYGLGRIKTE